MALGGLVTSVEGDYYHSRSGVNTKERLLQERKGQLEKLKKASEASEEQIRVIKSQSDITESMAETLNEDIHLGLDGLLRYEQHLDMLVQRNRSEEKLFQRNDHAMQRELEKTEQYLQAQITRYQCFPKAKELSHAEEERIRLKNLIKVLTMKQSNAAKGLKRADPTAVTVFAREPSMEPTSTMLLEAAMPEDVEMPEADQQPALVHADPENSASLKDSAVLAPIQPDFSTFVASPPVVTEPATVMPVSLAVTTAASIPASSLAKPPVVEPVVVKLTMTPVPTTKPAMTPLPAKPTVTEPMPAKPTFSKQSSVKSAVAKKPVSVIKAAPVPPPFKVPMVAAPFSMPAIAPPPPTVVAPLPPFLMAPKPAPVIGAFAFNFGSGVSDASEEDVPLFGNFPGPSTGKSTGFTLNF